MWHDVPGSAHHQALGGHAQAELGGVVKGAAEGQESAILCLGWACK